MDEKTNILWVGLVAPEEIYKELLKKGYFHFAAQSCQKNFIEGIAECTDIKIDEISGFMMPTIPNIKEVVTKAYQWKTINGGQGVSVVNLNIPYVDIVVRTYQIKRACRCWANRHKDDNNIIFVYSAINSYLQGALEVRKICKHTKVCLIITDLPQFMELRPSRIKKFLKNLNWHTLNKAIKDCDSWIPFTKHMISYLNLPEEKCLVIEGTVNLKHIRKNIQDIRKNIQDIRENIQDKVIVMYSGSLGLQYGIPELLNAFSQINDDNYELWFSGKGNADTLISEYSQKDSRIKNYGFLESYEELMQVQNKASMLINTRMPSEKASAYCFPSKMFDYMLTGKPVLTFEIKGIPEEYYQYLVVMKSTSTTDIKKAILRVGEMTNEERDAIGNRARDFVIKYKNNIMQAQKICEFVGLGSK